MSRINWAAQPLGQMPDRKLASRLHVDPKSVKAAREAAGVAPYVNPSTVGVTKGIDWDSQPIETVHYVILAKTLGVMPQNVISAAKRRGIRWVSGSPAKPRLKPNNAPVTDGYDFRWLLRRLPSIAKPRLARYGLESWTDDVVQESAMIVHARMMDGHKCGVRTEQLAVTKAIGAMFMRTMSRVRFADIDDHQPVHDAGDPSYRAIALWRVEQRWHRLTERERLAMVAKATGDDVDHNTVRRARAKLELPCTP